MRKIFASREASEQAKQSSSRIVRVYSMFPVDRADCPCTPLIREWNKKLAMANTEERRQLIEQTPLIRCPRDTSHMQHYNIICSRCQQKQGDLWATSPRIEDWCDFHYFQWTEGDYWRGCFTPHISPVSEQLCFECCCGNDTRDFRANMTLPESIAVIKEEENRRGRQFGTKYSSFFVQLVP